MERDFQNTASWFGTGLAEAAKAAYAQWRAIHRLYTRWEDLPINSQNDWVLTVGRALNAYHEAEAELSLKRVLACLEDDELEFLRDEFVIVADRESVRIAREFARTMTDEEENDWYNPADQCQDEYEIRTFGQITSPRITKESR